MITDSELQIANQSYLHKDFYQIYPEILDLVGKITERWDPASSNESDPGVVLLKLLAFLGDKINYNIDKNILECFMPSATQEDSMRKLCAMMGYDMHYYVSATTTVSFMWIGDKLETTSNPSGSTGYIRIPKFTTISNSTEDDTAKKISYVLTEDVDLYYKGEVVRGLAIEGQLQDFPINDDNIVRIYNLDDKNRLYFPEPKVAENGVWIENANDPKDVWTRSLNLNVDISDSETHYWKFCFDSKRKLPYIQFPDNAAGLIKEGLKIRYVRTSGVNGNITAKVLTVLPDVDHVDYYVGSPDDISEVAEELPIRDDKNTFLVLQNSTYTQSGKDIETLDEAYESFKRTIGTFETLVTCRDYANAIYNLVRDPINEIPYVSNIQVSDIRDDINYSYKIATFDEFGLLYEDISTDTNVLNHFDIYLYPLNPIKSVYKASSYDDSFRPLSGINELVAGIEDFKTISHSFKQVPLASTSSDIIYLIKNYYHIKAQIATTYKVSKAEGMQILNNIYIALYKKFNARNLNYGDEIPYSIILDTLQKADSRIKYVSLSTDLNTKILTGDGQEHDINDSSAQNIAEIKKHLLTKNIFAGRLPLFNYKTDFNYTFGQKNTSIDAENQTWGAIRKYPDQTHQSAADIKKSSITSFSTNMTIPGSVFSGGYKLKKNETIQFRAKNIATKITYPVSVNYFFYSENQPFSEEDSIPAYTDYKLNAQDILFINYTDSNKVVHNIEYHGGNGSSISGPYYKDGVNDSEHSWSGIIRTNFVLSDSNWLNSQPESNRHTIAKDTSFGPDFQSGWGMYTLRGDNQIEIRDFVNTKFEGGTSLKCYWSTNNNNTMVLKRVSGGSSGESGSPSLFEYTLSANEYFFYTDDLESSLVTLGSGTTITYQDETQNPSVNQIVWKLTKPQYVDTDDIVDKGIAAFSDTSWQVLKLLQDLQSLALEENQIVILGEGSTVRFASSEASAPSSIDSTQWLDLSPAQAAGFSWDSGQTLPQSQNLGVNGEWKVRAILNLDIGPSTAMVLTKKSTDSITREITFRTSGWKLPGGATYITVDDDTDLNKCIEEIIQTNPIISISNVDRSDDISIRSNKAIQVAGGIDIPLHFYSYAGVLQDDMMIYPYIQDPCTIGDSTSREQLPISTYLNNYTTVPLDKLTGSKNIKLPTYIPKDSFGLFMIYYNQSTSESGGSVGVTITSEVSSSLSFYRDNYQGSGTAATSSLPLNPGINIVRVDESCTLTITSTDLEGSIVFSNIDIINTDGTDKTGVDKDLLDLSSKSEAEALVAYIISKDTDGRFYFNVPITNTSRMNVDTVDSYSWFDSNNICNKFVLAQIDTDLKDINIEISSRLGKW